VVIGLVGNPFSPAYARARAAGAADPLRFCALNVAIRGKRGALWSLRERAIAADDRGRDTIAFGPSEIRWVGDRLEVRIDERATPLFGLGLGPRRVRGTVTFRPRGLTGEGLTLDPAGRHGWWPVAPSGAIEVRLDEPGLRFDGHGYHDANAGQEPIERGFSEWTWSRGRTRGGDALVVYEALAQNGARAAHALRFDGRRTSRFSAPPLVPLGRSGWGITRAAHADLGATPRVAEVLEDTPFYSRNLVDTRMDGSALRVVHETLSARRLGQAWVRGLLGFKMGKA